MVTCRDVLNLKLDGVELLAGEEGLDRIVSWTYLCQTKPYRDHMNQGNFALVVVDYVRFDLEEAYETMLELSEIGISAYAISVVDDRDPIPSKFLEAANARRLPLFYVRWEGASFVDIDQSIGYLILESETQGKRTGDYLYNLLFGYDINEKYIEKISGQFGLDFSTPHRVGIIVVDRKYGVNLEQDEHVYDYYANTLNREVLAMEERPLFMRFLNKFVLLFEATADKRTEHALEKLLRDIDNRPPFKGVIRSTCITDYEGAHKVPGKVVPIIAIPTTAGTGSEVTAFSVITDHTRNYKLTVFSYELLPEYAILDPELITTVPASVAAACGIDAFIHAQEAYVSLAASPFSEAMSEKAMELIGGSIRSYVANRRDEAAAADMLTGSLLAGIAFSFARLGNIHAMSHPLSAYFDIPHGVANGVLLPVILEYNALADRGKYLKICNDISPMKKSAQEFKPEMLAEAARDLLRDIGIPEGIIEAVHSVKGKENITREEIEALIEPMAADACKSGNIAVNPRSSTPSDIIKLYKKAL